MRLVLGSDHAGFAMRRDLAAWLRENGHVCEEVGAASAERYDYPDAADELVARLADFDLGVLLCGTGIGISIRANRHPHVRAALCTTELMASLAREHNHANVLCLGARIAGPDQALAIVRAFLAGAESGEPRHEARVAKLDAPVESGESGGHLAGPAGV